MVLATPASRSSAAAATSHSNTGSHTSLSGFGQTLTAAGEELRRVSMAVIDPQQQLTNVGYIFARIGVMILAVAIIVTQFFMQSCFKSFVFLEFVGPIAKVVANLGILVVPDKNKRLLHTCFILEFFGAICQFVNFYSVSKALAQPKITSYCYGGLVAALVFIGIDLIVVNIVEAVYLLNKGMEKIQGIVDAISKPAKPFLPY